MKLTLPVSRLALRCASVLAAALLLAGPATRLSAAEKAWSGSSEVTLVSDYLWRGFKLADMSLQPSLSASYDGKLNIGFWGSYSLEDGDSGKYNESDLLASYTMSFEKFSLSLGGTLYRADNLRDPETGAAFDTYFESVVSLTFAHPLAPTITFWREYGRLSTNYIEFSISPSTEIGKSTRLSARPYYGAFEDSENYYGADIAVTHDFSDKLYARATLTLIKSSFGGDRAAFSVTSGLRW
jgi:hypothetical protein